MTFGLLSSVLQVGVWTASPRVHEMKSRGLSSDPVVSSIPVDDNIPASYGSCRPSVQSNSCRCCLREYTVRNSEEVILWRPRTTMLNPCANHKFSRTTDSLN